VSAKPSTDLPNELRAYADLLDGQIADPSHAEVCREAARLLVERDEILDERRQLRTRCIGVKAERDAYRSALLESREALKQAHETLAQCKRSLDGAIAAPSASALRRAIRDAHGVALDALASADALLGKGGAE
jgi:hypothetical protein